MNKILALITIISLAGCAATPSTPQQSQLSYAEACGAYGAAFATALQLRIAGKLSQSQISQISLVDSQITPICTGAIPANPTEAAAKVTAAITSIATIEALKASAK